MGDKKEIRDFKKRRRNFFKMKKHFIFFITILLLFLTFLFLFLKIQKYRHELWQELQQTVSSQTNHREDPQKFVLDVPYINEAPDGNFSGNWKNACEEASMTMIEKYYAGQKSVGVIEAMSFMQNLFDIEDRIYGSNADTDTVRTARIMNDYLSYGAIIKDNPTINDIKKQLLKKHPVMSFHYGYDLQNSNIPFAVHGTYYHTMVIIGYDDKTQEFITHDDGDQKFGANHRYGYDLFMGSLHDYNFADGKADGTPRVIFTYPKLVKLANSPQVYYLHDNVKQYVPDEATFNAKGWTWNMVNIVEKSWLDNFVAGTDIKI
jgi:uncharacterized protein YvpB